MNSSAILAVTGLLQILVLGGTGAGISWWLIDDPILGAVFGVGIYLAMGLAFISSDVLELKRETGRYRATLRVDSEG